MSILVLDNGMSHSDHTLVFVDVSRPEDQEVLEAWLALANYQRTDAWGKWFKVATVQAMTWYQGKPLTVEELVREEFCRGCDADDEAGAKALAKVVMELWAAAEYAGPCNWQIEYLAKEGA